MLNDYTFLTDHSYSLRPVVDDQEEEETTRTRNDGAKKKKSRQSSARTKKSESTVAIANRPASIDRSSSDKENNSSVVLPGQSARQAKTSAKSSTTGRITKKKTPNSRRTRTTMSTTKTSSIKSKKKVNGNPAKTDLIDTTPALSIEERVKLRRTTPITVNPSQTSASRKKSSTKKTHSVQEDLKQIRQSMKKNARQSASNNTHAPTPSTVKTKKSFLGSGLDLDNIVLGNRQRRHVQS